MKKTQKELKAARREKKWYGMKKIRKGEKICWLAREDKNGYSLGVCFGGRTLWLRNLRIESVSELKKVLKASVVFVHLKK